MRKKKTAAKIAVGIALATAAAYGGSVVTRTDDPAKSVQNVAPIAVGEGTLSAGEAVYDPIAESKLPPKASDGDGDGVVNTRDACPWDKGTNPNGCP